MVKLIVHIGHGKTGSSSIQQSLLAARSQLVAQNVKYLGLMLEHAHSAQNFAWQVMSGSDRFFDNTPPDTANAQLTALLDSELQQLAAQKVETAIWSNEWILTRSRSVLPALQELQRRGHVIELQCYVRRHDKWAQSAYAQWGLKHKTYQGHIRDFASWLPVFGDRDFRFAPSLSIWEAAFGTDLRVFNFDTAGDVVQHFMSINGLKDVPSIHENISPDATITAAQAVFNGRSKAPVLPMAFDRIQILAEKSDENRGTLPPLDRLAPSVEALAALVRDRAEDISRLNTLLLRSGEPPLSFDTPPRQMQHPSPWEMDQLLLKLIFGLADEVEQLRGQVAALQKIAASQTSRDPQ